jgi:polar amino acid transport system substrate-binding protein
MDIPMVFAALSVRHRQAWNLADSPASMPPLRFARAKTVKYGLPRIYADLRTSMAWHEDRNNRLTSSCRRPWGRDMRLLKVMGCLVSLVLVGALAGAPVVSRVQAKSAHEPQASGDTLSNIQKRGVIRVGVAVNAPWVLRDKDGQWIGLDIDLVRQFAQDMRWQIELVPTTWASAIDDLHAGHFDLLAAGLSVTPQRALLLKYSHPYGNFALGLVVNNKALGKDDLLTLETGTGKHKIAVLSGTITAATAKEYLGNSDLVEINDETKAIQDLRSGALDGLIAEQPLPDAVARTYPDQLHTLDVSNYGKTAHAFAVRGTDQNLADVVNAWLTYQDASGWIQSRKEFWIHSPAWIGLMQPSS